MLQADAWKFYTVDSVAAIRAQLWDSGFRPIAVLNADHPDPKVAGKAPIGRDWGKRARQTPPEAVVLPPVKHAYSIPAFSAMDCERDRYRR